MSPPASFRVLIVEDEPTARWALQALLEAEGYLVQSAARGDVALDLQRASPPDLLLADLGLPDADGLTVARTARTESGCAVLMMTGSEHARHQDLGFDVVMKPIVLEQLLVQVRRALSRRPS